LWCGSVSGVRVGSVGLSPGQQSWRVNTCRRIFTWLPSSLTGSNRGTESLLVLDLPEGSYLLPTLLLCACSVFCSLHSPLGLEPHFQASVFSLLFGLIFWPLGQSLAPGLARLPERAASTNILREQGFGDCSWTPGLFSTSWLGEASKYVMGDGEHLLWPGC
jgi:hypothetical protein